MYEGQKSNPRINNRQNLMKVINDIQDAKTEDGGSGAFYILLKKKRSIK